jgi:hypothetical protein
MTPGGDPADVSVDLVVWEGPRPANDEEARATFESLRERFLGSSTAPASKKIADYVSQLLARYPDGPSGVEDVGADEVPWGSGPLLGNASGPVVYIDMKVNSVFEDGWRHCVDTAASQGLVAFDPQSGALARPDPELRPAAWVPTDRRGGPAYRWVSLRSWRWPFLRPLLPLLRRFL